MTPFARTIAASWTPVAKALPLRTILGELITVTGAAVLAAFLMLFALRVPYDNASFVLALDFDHAGTSGTSGTALAIRENAAHVAPLATPPTGGSHLADGINAHAVALGFFDPQQDDSVAALTRMPALTPGAVVVDQATLARFELEVGDTLVILKPGAELHECAVTVAGTLPPYHAAKDLGAGGLVVMSRDECQREVPGLTDSGDSVTVHCFDCAGAADTSSRWVHAVRASVGFTESPLATVALGTIGAALWIIATRRARRRLRAMASTTVSAIRAIGASPRAVRALVTTWWMAITTVGALFGSALASALMTRVAHLYIQGAMVVAVTGILIVVAFAFRPRRNSHHLTEGQFPRG